MSPSYRNQSIDLLLKSMDWFLYDRNFRHERGKCTYLVETEVRQYDTEAYLEPCQTSKMERFAENGHSFQP